MSQYSFFQAIPMSFYSGKLYRDVAQHWGGKVFLYLLLLLSFTWVLPTIEAQAGINFFYSQFANLLVTEVPVITIVNGKLSTPRQGPYLIKNITDPANEDKTLAIIDTSGQYTNLDNTDAAVLVTDTKVITKRHQHELRIYDIPTDYTATFNPASINEVIKGLIGYAWIVIYLSLLFVSFIYRLILALFYSVLGVIFNAATSSRVNFASIFLISVVALTPAILLSTLCQLASVHFPLQPFFYFIISIGYMCYGIRANKT